MVAERKINLVWESEIWLGVNIIIDPLYYLNHAVDNVVNLMQSHVIC